MTATTRPTRFPVLLVVAMLAFTISACGGNPGGPDPIPSPSPTPVTTWIAMRSAPVSGSTVRIGESITISADYYVAETYSERVMVLGCLSLDGVTTLQNGACRGQFATNPPQPAVMRPALSPEDAELLGITRTDYIIVQLVREVPGGGSSNDIVIARQVHNVVLNYIP